MIGDVWFCEMSFVPYYILLKLTADRRSRAASLWQQNFCCKIIKVVVQKRVEIYRPTPGVSKKSNRPKTGIFSLRLPTSFCVKFCKFVGNSYSHNYIYHFLQIYLNISSSGVNYSTTTHHFHLLKFWVGLFTWKIKMQLFGNDVIFVIASLGVR